MPMNLMVWRGFVPPRRFRGAIWRKFLDAFDARQQRRATARRLQSLGDRDLADIGLKRSDIPKVASKVAIGRPLTIEDGWTDHLQFNEAARRG